MAQDNPNTDIAAWLTDLTKTHSYLDNTLLTSTVELASSLGEPSDSPDFSASIKIGTQLLALNSDSETIAACLLYPFFEDSEKNRLLIQKKLTPAIYKLLSGTKRMEAIDKLPIQDGNVILNSKQLDNLRRMLLAIVDDVRIVLIKLAERIIELEQQKNSPETNKQMVANQCMALYAPLANRLGIGQFKWQLEDWSFRFLNPDKYSEISKGLNQRRADREAYIDDMKSEITDLLAKTNIKEYKLTGRAKHIYSIFKKQQRKHVSLEEIYDSNAFRILVPSIDDCYNLLSLFHEKYKHVAKEFDDYIAKPKTNGYRSIHTVIIGPGDFHVEIQLRTFDMHAEAELGVAAHWKYKESGGIAENYENKINLLRDIIDWQQELGQSDDNQDTSYSQLFEDRVYVFTPKNDIYDLPVGATPLDVAYAIHSEVGHRCKGAKVNNKIVPLTATLKTGDVIEILTHKQGQPSRDWVNPERGYLTTRSAINKVKAWFRHQYQTENISKGQEIWEKVAKREGLSKQSLAQILPTLHMKQIEDIFIGLALGHLTVPTLIRKLKPTEEQGEDSNDKESLKPIRQSQAPMANTQNMLSTLAKCCNPIPGDNIIGYITKGRGISIHRNDCHNFIAASNIYPERAMEVSWGDNTQQKYPISVELIARERPGLVRDISTLIANLKITLLGISSQINAQGTQCNVNLTLEIEDKDSLQKIVNQLEQLSDVIKAARKK